MTFILIAQMLVGLLLGATILLQSRGTGLGSTWGGGGGSYHTKRGAERLLFMATIILSVLFVILSLLNTIV
ncbi:MAG: preprotein translocase subunit SecG [Candidatus Chisholmbacteria bacterium]|nr:preprotein translocase subunit SecG [Candidatus Chisholmbacteria bacterium]